MHEPAPLGAILVLSLVLFAGLPHFAAAQPAPSALTFEDYVGATNWNVVVTEDETGCGGSVLTKTAAVSIQHNMKAANIGSWGHGNMQGSFSGNTLSMPGRTIKDGDGNSRLDAFNVAFAPDCSGFSGRYGWFYSDAYMSCSGTTSLKGTRAGSEQGCPFAEPPEECSGLDCCQYEEYENSGLCSCSGEECCNYEEYKNTALCVVSPPPTPNESCSGVECCQYEEYKNTPLCVVPPTPKNDSCTAPAPQCPVGGWAGGSAPMLLDPAIASGSKCRGACGPDCPDTCASMPDETRCIADSKGECYYVCTYYNVKSCGVHTGCETHDDCYDACAAQGEKSLCAQLSWPFVGPCHCSCDFGCYLGHGLSNCWDWMNGKGPAERHVLYSSPPLRSGPVKACPQPSAWAR